MERLGRADVGARRELQVANCVLRQELTTDVTRRRDEGYTYENLVVRLPGLAVALRNPVIEETHRALHGVGELREAVLDVVLQVRRGAGTGPRRMPLRRRSYI
jgi:hypothetical protein